MLGNLQPSNVYTLLHLFEHMKKGSGLFVSSICGVAEIVHM